MALQYYKLPMQMYYKMDWIGVKSSNLARTYLHAETKQMYVEFHKKTKDIGADERLVYVYFDVSVREYNKVITPKTKGVGERFNDYVKTKKKWLRVQFI